MWETEWWVNVKRVFTRLQTPAWTTVVWMEVLASTVDQRGAFACLVMEETCARQVQYQLSDKQMDPKPSKHWEDHTEIISFTLSHPVQTWRRASPAGRSFRASVIVTLPRGRAGRRPSSTVACVVDISCLSWPPRSRTTSTVELKTPEGHDRCWVKFNFFSSGNTV